MMGFQLAIDHGFPSPAVAADIYRVREKKDVFVLKLLKVNLEGSGVARAEFDSEARILAQLQARVHPGMLWGGRVQGMLATGAGDAVYHFTFYVALDWLSGLGRWLPLTPPSCRLHVMPHGQA